VFVGIDQIEDDHTAYVTAPSTPLRTIAPPTLASHRSTSHRIVPMLGSVDVVDVDDEDEKGTGPDFINISYRSKSHRSAFKEEYRV